MNKRTILTVIIAFLMAVPAIAQDNPARTLMGLKAGLNYSTLLGDLDNAEYKLGGVAGLTTSINFSERFGLQMDILFSQKGAETEFRSAAFSLFEALDMYTEATTTINYIEAPILLKLTWPIDKLGPRPYRFQRHNFFLSAFAGPYVAYPLSGEATGTTTSTIFTEQDTLVTILPYSKDLNVDNLEMIDLGVTVGTELKIHMGQEVYFLLDVRASRGFLSIDYKGDWGSYSSTGSYSPADIFNQHLSGTIGIAMAPYVFARPFMSASARDAARRRGR